MDIARSLPLAMRGVRNGRVEASNQARSSRDFAKAAFNVLLALVLLGALAMSALPPAEWDDPWLRVGTILLVLGLASWLRWSLLVPAVALVWLLPLALHGATQQLASSPGPLAELLALELIALGWMTVYRLMLTGRGAADRELSLPRRTSYDSTRERERRDQFEKCGLAMPADPESEVRGRAGVHRELGKLSQDDASYLLKQLERIRGELSESRHEMRLAVSLVLIEGGAASEPY